MSVIRARIIKATPGEKQSNPSSVPTLRGPFARRIPALVVNAHAEAESIVHEARTSIASVVEDAVREAREREVARLCAEHIQLRVGEEERARRDLDRTIEIATLLAERLIGEAISVEPQRIAVLAQHALSQTRGARSIRIEACDEDLPALHALFTDLSADVLTIELNPELQRGSLIVHTNLGRVDARLAPQLAQLGAALREALLADTRNPKTRPLE